MEAEHYQANVSVGNYAWMPVTNSGYSGSGALQILPDDGPSPSIAGAGPRLDYQVQFTTTGTHYIWIRALSHSFASDSLHVGLDGATASAKYMIALNQDGHTWAWSNETPTGAVGTLTVASPGVHTVNVWMRESGIVLDKLVLTTSASYVPTGTGPAETIPAEYVAIGDSITAGSHDDISSDGVGFEPVLGNLLTADKGYPVGVVKEGVSGTSSADGAASISSTLAKYPTAKYYLIMYGTNDAYIPPILSGMGLIPGDPGYYGSFKDNMQRIVSAILAAGKTPYLAEIPYTSDPLRRNEMIYEYNAAIDELVITNNILVSPPSFYAYFMNHQGELADGIHPNGTGYQSMANLWFGALTN
jgi:lysophospholipase L1-like esterase